MCICVVLCVFYLFGSQACVCKRVMRCWCYLFGSHVLASFDSRRAASLETTIPKQGLPDTPNLPTNNIPTKIA